MTYGVVLSTYFASAGPPLADRMMLLCDGASRPNPGTMLPIVFDGRTFLLVPPVSPGTNHRAVWEAVAFGFLILFPTRC